MLDSQCSVTVAQTAARIASANQISTRTRFELQTLCAPRREVTVLRKSARVGEGTQPLQRSLFTLSTNGQRRVIHAPSRIVAAARVLKRSPEAFSALATIYSQVSSFRDIFTTRPPLTSYSRSVFARR